MNACMRYWLCAEKSSNRQISIGIARSVMLIWLVHLACTPKQWVLDSPNGIVRMDFLGLHDWIVEGFTQIRILEREMMCSKLADQDMLCYTAGMRAIGFQKRYRLTSWVMKVHMSCRNHKRRQSEQSERLFHRLSTISDAFCSQMSTCSPFRDENAKAMTPTELYSLAKRLMYLTTLQVPACVKM